MFFESIHSIDDKEFSLRFGQNLNYPPHLHLAFEFFCVTEGQTKVTVDQVDYDLKKGQAVLIFPYQVHSYEVIEHTFFVGSIFSPWLVPQFYQSIQTKHPFSNLFFYDKKIEPPTNIYQQKGLLYDICGQFHQTARYESFDSKKTDLTTRLLLYITEHYKSECLLKDVAKEIGYDYVYLSKFFKKSTGVPFHAYVNNMRLQEGIRMLSSTNLPVNQIAEECGFASVRTFHREFRQFTSLSPTEYRKTHTR